MAKTRKIRCPLCGFLDTIKKGKPWDIPATYVKIVIVILQTAALISQIEICLFGLFDGYEIGKVFRRYQSRADIAKGR